MSEKDIIKISGSGCDSTPAGTKSVDAMMKSASDGAIHSVVFNLLMVSPSDVFQGNAVDHDALEDYVGTVADVEPKNGIYADTPTFIKELKPLGGGPGFGGCSSFGVGLQATIDIPALRQLLIDKDILQDGEEATDVGLPPSGTGEEPEAPVTTDPEASAGKPPPPTKTMPVPPPRTEVTHKVSTSGSRLALRLAPAWQKVSESANKDNHIKGDKVAMLANGTKFIVLDEGVGYKCQWSRVRVSGYEDKETYVFNKFTKSLAGVPPSLKISCSDDAIANPDASFIDWTKQPDLEPYSDPQTGTRRVVVPLSYTSTGGSEIRKRMEEALVPGVKEILYVHGKKGGGDSDEDLNYINDLQSHLYFAQASEWYIDPRPESKLKILVQIPKKYIEELDDAPEITVDPETGVKGDVRWDIENDVYRDCLLYTSPSPRD